MNELSQIISDATGAIDNSYFRLQLDGGDPVYRERVYCYELYHQMRLRWPENTTYVLNGEVDKAAHPILCRLSADHVKPDLLVHRPGYMSGNHAIIEVKPSNASSRGIKKDIESLSLFIKTVGYQRAIYLIYGNDAGETKIEQIRRIAGNIEDIASIELWIHQHANRCAFHFATIG
jgi:hypothetical protein